MSLEQKVVELRDEDTHHPMQWSVIGDRLGISRDAARRAYSRGKGSAFPPEVIETLSQQAATPLQLNEAEIAVQKGDFRRWAKKANWLSILESLKDGILEDIRIEAYDRTPLSDGSLGTWDKDGLLLEVAPVDAHFGKLSWEDETGHNFDVTIAERAFGDRIADIALRAPAFGPIAEIAFVVGNDALQTDNLLGTTTGGTFVDTDTRYIRSFRRARRAHSAAIRRLSEIAPVRVVVVPGNHDRLTAFHLGEVLAAEFADHPNVVVDASPTLRKYYRFGTCLLGWTHGSEEKVADLPLLMAQERPEDWAASTWREYHIGHLHRVRQLNYSAADSFNGVRVRVLPALCAPDAWHVQHGYTSEQRATEAFLWHPKKGYMGHLSSNVQTSQEKKAA